MSDYASAKVKYAGSTITLLQRTKQIYSIVDDSLDDDLSYYLQLSGEAAESYTDNKLCLQEATEKYPVVKYPVALRYWPFVSLTSVTEDGEDVTAEWETFLIDGISYATPSRTSDSLSRSYEQLVITYQTGYDPLPAELGELLARAAINASKQAAGPVKKESIVGVGSVEYVTDDDVYGGFSASALSILDRYRRLYV